jgi:hypothetical protein
MKAVEMMTPVPNCLNVVNTRLLGETNFQAKMGVKTPIELVTRMTNNRPTLRLML